MLYYIVRGILIPFVYLLFLPKVKGRENLPKDGSTIVYSNHISLLDPVLLGCLFPRKIYFMAKQELFRSRIGYWFFTGLGAIPVKRGSADISAIKTALKKLKDGKVFGIFPEGTRSKKGDIQEFTHGMAAIAQRSKAVTVPVLITGNYRLFHSMKITIGKPLDLKEYYGQKSNSQLLSLMSEEMSAAVIKINE